MSNSSRKLGARGEQACRLLLTTAAIGVAIFFLARLLVVSYYQFAAPFDLAFETPNFGTIQVIRGGQNPYDPDVYTRPPFIITIYTPVYHYLVALLPDSPDNPFFYGRLVSCLSMAGAAVALFLVNMRGTRLVLSWLAFGVFFSFWPVVSNTAFLKNDSLALLFSASALTLLYNFRRRTWAPIVSAGLCILAVATKQSYVAAGVACAIYLLLADRRQFWVFAVSSICSAVACAAMATSVLGMGFWFSTIGALRHSISVSHALGPIAVMLSQPVFLGLLIVTTLMTWSECRRSGGNVFRESPYFLFVLASGAVLVLTIGKDGSSTNYFFELLLGQLLWVVFALGNRPIEDFCKPQLAWIAVLFLVCCVLEAFLANPDDYSFAGAKLNQRSSSYFNSIRGDLASLNTEDPDVLNLFAHRETYYVSDRDFVNDPNVYKLLWKAGILERQSIIDSIAAGTFDVIMVPEGITPTTQMDAPLDDILPTVFLNYRISKNGTGYNYYVRKNNGLPRSVRQGK